MDKPVIIVGVPIISRLFRGEDVVLENAALIPDDQLHNLAHASKSSELATASNSQSDAIALCKEIVECVSNGHNANNFVNSNQNRFYAVVAQQHT